jgi:hypothetical protein
MLPTVALVVTVAVAQAVTLLQELQELQTQEAEVAGALQTSLGATADQAL